MIESPIDRDRGRELLAWIRRNLLIILFSAMIGMQVLTWMEIRKIDIPDYGRPCGGSSPWDRPCRVIVIPP